MVLDSWSNWNLEMLIFSGGRKTGKPGEKSSKQGREVSDINCVMTLLWPRKNMVCFLFFNFSQ
jgi:hypothetical protein